MCNRTTTMLEKRRISNKKTERESVYEKKEKIRCACKKKRIKTKFLLLQRIKIQKGGRKNRKGCLKFKENFQIILD